MVKLSERYERYRRAVRNARTANNSSALIERVTAMATLRISLRQGRRV